MSPKRDVTCSGNVSRTACIAFLVVWAVAKFKSPNCFLNRPHTIQDFKDSIRADIALISQERLRKVMPSVRRRVRVLPGIRWSSSK
jgi:hypothetical protein